MTITVKKRKGSERTGKRTYRQNWQFWKMP